MPTGRGSERVPAELDVVVGVHVDEARGHGAALGIDDAPGFGLEIAYSGDLAVLYCNVSPKPRAPTAIHDGPALDYCVVTHVSTLPAET